MPEISRFYGLIILMNFKDDNPPHFHVWYGNFKAIITIQDGIVKGEMPQRALKISMEMADRERGAGRTPELTRDTSISRSFPADWEIFHNRKLGV